MTGHTFSTDELSKTFVPSYCVTVYKYQGGTIKNEACNVFDVRLMDKKQLYTALSRCTDIGLVRWDNAQLLPRYTTRRQPTLKLTGVHGSAQQNGKIYEVTFEASARVYIGCTCEELENKAPMAPHRQEERGARSPTRGAVDLTCVQRVVSGQEIARGR